jgi:hypothetical protein
MEKRSVPKRERDPPFKENIGCRMNTDDWPGNGRKSSVKDWLKR